MVVGMTAAAMLCSFGAHCSGFMAKGVVSVFREVAPNPRYARMALAGRRYSIAAGTLSMLQGLIATMAAIAGPIEMVAANTAGSMMGLFYGFFFAEFVCGHLHHAFSGEL